jgi:hypothetical protein
MEQEILEKLKNQEQKLSEIQTSIEKIRSYLFWTMVITLAFIILPLIGLLIAIPKFLNTFTGI